MWHQPYVPVVWTEPVVTDAATSEPVSLAEAKAHCRVEGTDSDTELNIYLVAAREYVEKYTGLRLAEQTVTFSRRYFDNYLPLPVAPIQSLTVEYLDDDNVSQALASTFYDFSGANTLRPVLSKADGQSWPSLYNAPEAVTVTAVVGFAVVPDAIRAAILLHTAHLYENREAVGDGRMVELPLTVSALLENYRIFS